MEQTRTNRTAKILLTALLSVVMTLAMFFAILPATTLTAYAGEASPYADLKNTITVITFDGKDWYLIDYDSTTVTLLSKECVGVSKFSDNDSNTYSGSAVESFVNSWYTNNISADAKAAVKGNGMFLLTTDQANAMTTDQRKCSPVSGADFDRWWLCSPGGKRKAARVNCEDGSVDGGGNFVSFKYGVRPALQLNLSKVTFDSAAKTFNLGSSVDKTALTDAITAAETLYNSIKDNTDYTEIASTLQTAIDAAKTVANNDEADQDAIDTATTNITNAKTTAEAAKKDVDDTKAANAVIAKINALPSTDAITSANKDAIEAARAAYNALTNDQNAKVDADTLKKLTDAETALAAAEQKEADDTAAAQNVTDIINALPAADDVTTSDKAAIEAARAAYDALTDDQKVKVTNYNTLTEAEDSYKIAETEALIAAIGTVKYTAECKAKIDEAKAAYEALTPEQKALVTNYSVLTAAEETYAEKEAEATAKKGLPGGVIALIVILCVLVVGCGAFAIVWFAVKKKTWAEFVAIFKKK